MNGIQINNLSIKIGNNKILNDVNCYIPRMKITGLIGNNGAGKTSLIKCLTSFYTDYEGKIEIENEKINNKKISYIPDSPVYYEELTFYEHIEFISAINNAKESVDYYINMFDVKTYLNKFPNELSKGTLQRMMIIMALLRKKKFLIADEPFDGLDPGQVNVLKMELKKLKEEGSAILLSSHQLSLVEEICDSFIFIKDGEIIYTVDKDSKKQSISKLYHGLLGR